jgi:hypothetical protein
MPEPEECRDCGGRVSRRGLLGGAVGAALAAFLARVRPARGALEDRGPFPWAVRHIGEVRRGQEPPFENKQGTYKDPDLVIAGGRVQGPVPKTLDCEVPFVIYSSWAKVVESCEDFDGPDDGDNEVCEKALENAEAVAARIACPTRCPRKIVTEIWRGWECELDSSGEFFVAICAVEIEVICLLQI